MTRFASSALVAACAAIFALPATAQQVQLQSGIYKAAGGQYEVVVDVTDGVIRTVEPNHVSTYSPTPKANIYHYTSTGARTAGTVYGLRVIDARNFEAFKPSLNGQGTAQPGTLFAYSGPLPSLDQFAGPPAGDETRGQALAEKYQKKMEADPANTHLWAACAMAAFVLGQSDAAGFAEYAATAVSTIKPIMENPRTNPCPDVFPDKMWAAN